MLPAALGHMVPIGELDIDYGGPAFIVQSLRGGRICQQEHLPACNLIFEEGRDLFLHQQKRNVIPLVDGSTDSTMVALVTQVTTLQILLGEGETVTLLEALGLASMPALAVRAIPRQINAPLHHAMSKSLAGPAQKLYAQAKVLEYLSGLSEHLCLGNVREVQPGNKRVSVAACHDYLLGLEGKLPSLLSLGQMFQLSVKHLNAGFKDAYGESIYSFHTARQLHHARQALLQTDVPMKELAHRLGYSHVNNFIAAFRNRFGHSPGSLRKQAAEPKSAKLR